MIPLALLRYWPYIAIAVLGAGLAIQTARVDKYQAKVETVQTKLAAANRETATANASVERCAANNRHNSEVIEELQRDRRLADTLAADEVKRLHAELARKPKTREVIREKACTGPVGDATGALLDILRERDRDAGNDRDDAVRDGAPEATGSAPRLPR